MEIWPADLAAVGFQRIQAQQPMDEIRNAPQCRLQFFRGFGGDAGAKAAGRHIDEIAFVIDLGQIDRYRSALDG
ncbi:hypothetical protein D3C81_1952660 [compost metagenome]